MTGELILRTAESIDAAALADAWREFGASSVDLDPAQFRVPDSEGLVEWFADRLGQDLGDDALWMVAERNEQLIAFVEAQIWRPAAGADRHIMRDLGEVVLKVDSLMVRAADRRSGVGQSLMSSVEQWGRSRGATRAVVIAYGNSPSAVPFYEERMSYRRRPSGSGNFFDVTGVT